MYVQKVFCVLTDAYFTIGILGQFTATIIRNPAGAPVDESNNTFDYPILSSVTLTCVVTSSDGSTTNVISNSYHWNTSGCYAYAGRTPKCFPHSKTTQSVVGNNLTAEDAGTFNCTAGIDGVNYTSNSVTLRISGEIMKFIQSICVSLIKSLVTFLLNYHVFTLHQIVYIAYLNINVM